MKKGKYEDMLKLFLGEKKYKEINEYTAKRIKEKFGTQTRYVTKRLIYANHSAILIVATLKAKETCKSDIIKVLHINDMNSSKYLIEKDIDKFIEVYSEYINIIVKSMQKQGKR